MFRYKLQPYAGPASRHRCPQCNTPRSLALYIDTQTGQILNNTTGRCNREQQCGYHSKPRNFLGLNTTPQQQQVQIPPPVPQQFIEQRYLTESLAAYTDNHFVSYLCSIAGTETAMQAAMRYFIGSSKHWPGATVFWQLNATGSIHTGKIMLYSPHTGKRVKQPYNHITWVHSLLKMPGGSVKQCFFGEHLLTNSSTPIAITESEKTAVIASIYMPHLTWLACGGLSNLTADKCKVLKKRNVMLFPDLGCFDKWTTHAQQLSHLANFTVSNLLEQNATLQQRQYGADLADYLLQFKPADFIQPPAPAYQPHAFTGLSGAIYIKTAGTPNTYTQYPNADAYTLKSKAGIPVTATAALADFKKVLGLC